MAIAIQGEDQLKRDARRLKNELAGELTLSQCFEKIARDNGFNTYAAMRDALKTGNFRYVHGTGMVAT